MIRYGLLNPNGEISSANTHKEYSELITKIYNDNFIDKNVEDKKEILLKNGFLLIEDYLIGFDISKPITRLQKQWFLDNEDNLSYRTCNVYLSLLQQLKLMEFLKEEIVI